MAKTDNHLVSSSSAISALYAGTTSLTLFWILVLFKKAWPWLADLLRWNDAIGPLSGTFGVGLIALVLSYLLFDKSLANKKDQELVWHEKNAVKLFVVASILVFLMIFPPILEPIAELFHSK